MENYKPWYLSKTIWASLVAVAAGIAAPFGVDVSQDLQQDLTNIVLQSITVVASLIAILGRLSATARIE